ncbi:MAG: hypothetical protein IE911_18455, partial [Brevundimonas sp.]|nr:hypothetical protein [Brevundimonas sp.]
GYAVTLPTAGHGKRRPFSATGEKIRVGYLSNDFYCHPMMTLFLRTMASHDTERFELRLFSYTEPHAATKQEEWPEHLRRAVIPVGELSDAAAAACIDAERIDILVDLKGHTMGARLGIVNLCGAPVKATYLGYPGSVTGVDLDYAITDPVVTPDTSKPFYGEKLCRLPETYQANDWQARPLPAFMEREDAGLPEDAFVFGAFNAPYKITPRTLSLWAEVLRAVPDAVLWVLCPLPLARRNLLAALEALGVARHRVFFAERKAGAAHIDRLPLADLGLGRAGIDGHLAGVLIGRRLGEDRIAQAPFLAHLLEQARRHAPAQGHGIDLRGIDVGRAISRCLESQGEVDLLQRLDLAPLAAGKG